MLSRWLFLLTFFTYTTLSMPIMPKWPEMPSSCAVIILAKEARGEPEYVQKAVLDVLTNRMRARGKDACDIMREYRQFSWYNSKIKYSYSKLDLTRYKIAAKMSEQVGSDCMWFHSGKAPVWTKKMKSCGKLGKLKFYKLKEK